ncbi:hypothetical protein NE237_010043 [Protea cynaroides]|uniref:Uncharacterized protein n=1 Tax=Protea cynaroides TaxID=273540 RepID=A0A9Q0KYU2_9MAGN|nr:hypothetical protein NE237_010043 [Protea cynaroides]
MCFVVLKWYQSLAMDKRVEQIESKIESLSSGQKEILNPITEIFNKLTTRVDQLSVHYANEVSENSACPLRVQEGRQDGNGFHNGSSSSSYTTKLIPKIETTNDEDDNIIDGEDLEEAEAKDDLKLPSFKFHGIWLESDEIRFLQGLLVYSTDGLVFPHDLPIKGLVIGRPCKATRSQH